VITDNAPTQIFVLVIEAKPTTGFGLTVIVVYTVLVETQPAGLIADIE
jgi:hypothetical protein